MMDITKTLLNALPEQVCWKDLSLNFLGCNERFANSGGYCSPKDVIGKSDFDMSWHEGAEKIRASDFEVISSKLPKLNHIEKQIGTDGKDEYILVNKIPLFESGKTVGILVTLLNVTEKVMLQKKLETALEVVYASGKTNNNIINNMHNDWRAPVVNLRNYIQMAIDEKNDLEKKENLEIAASAAKSLHNIIDKSLALFDAENGRPIYSNDHFHAVESAQMVYDLYRPSAIEKQIDFTFVNSIESTADFIFCDQFRVEKILIAIVDNALKYTEKSGHVKLRLQSGKNNAHHKVLRFSVEDDGVGLSSVARELMFEPFFGRDFSHGKNKGIGAGLTIAKKYLEDINGELFCKSEPGKGTMFIVTIPVGSSSSPMLFT